MRTELRRYGHFCQYVIIVCNFPYKSVTIAINIGFMLWDLLLLNFHNSQSCLTLIRLPTEAGIIFISRSLYSTELWGAGTWRLRSNL